MQAGSRLGSPVFAPGRLALTQLLRLIARFCAALPSPAVRADVYFPKRKDTFRRRPFCFVTFNRLEDAQVGRAGLHAAARRILEEQCAPSPHAPALLGAAACLLQPCLHRFGTAQRAAATPGWAPSCPSCSCPAACSPCARPAPCVLFLQRALAESPMNICGIPIKQLNLVEDRADYYKHRHNGGWANQGVLTGVRGRMGGCCRGEEC